MSFKKVKKANQQVDVKTIIHQTQQQLTTPQTYALDHHLLSYLLHLLPPLGVYIHHVVAERRWQDVGVHQAKMKAMLRPRVTPPPARGLTPARQTPSRRSCRSRVMPHFLFMFPAHNYHFETNCVLIA